MPIPKAPTGFANLGDYVEHNRNVQDVERANAMMSVIEEDEEQEAEQEEREPPDASESPLRSGPPEQLALLPDASNPSSQLATLPSSVPDGAAPDWDIGIATFELHAAARLDDADRVRFLLLQGQSGPRPLPVDSCDEKGETAAVGAAQNKCVSSVVALLSAGADPLARDAHPNLFGDGAWPDERKPDHHGTFKPKPKAQAQAQGKGQAQGQGQTQGGVRSGRSVVYHLRLHGLFDSVLAKLSPAVRASLVRSLSRALEDVHGMPALVYAARRGQVELGALLVTHAGAFASRPAMELDTSTSSAGARQREVRRPGVVPCSHPERAEALLAATVHKQWRFVEVLLAAGIPRGHINNTKDSQGRTALHVAAHEGDVETVRRLLDAGALHTVYSMKGMQPLHEACASGKADAAAELIEGRADPTAKVLDTKSVFFCDDNRGMTPHDMAATHGHTHVCSRLISTGQVFPPAPSKEPPPSQPQVPGELRLRSPPVRGAPAPRASSPSLQMGARTR